MANETLTPLQIELLKRADSIMDSVSNTVGKATDFATDQIPDIAIQYITYGRAITTTQIAICSIIIIVALWLIIRVGIMDSFNLQEKNYESIRFVAILAGCMIFTISSLVLAFNMSKFLMVWFAPKVWLMTELVNLIKQ